MEKRLDVRLEETCRNGLINDPTTNGRLAALDGVVDLHLAP